MNNRQKYRKKLKESHSYFRDITEKYYLEYMQEVVDEYIDALSDEHLKIDYDYLMENDNG